MPVHVSTMSQYHNVTIQVSLPPYLSCPNATTWQQAGLSYSCSCPVSMPPLRWPEHICLLTSSVLGPPDVMTNMHVHSRHITAAAHLLTHLLCPSAEVWCSWQACSCLPTLIPSNGDMPTPAYTCALSSAAIWLTCLKICCVPALPSVGKGIPDCICAMPLLCGNADMTGLFMHYMWLFGHVCLHACCVLVMQCCVGKLAPVSAMSQGHHVSTWHSCCAQHCHVAVGI